MNDVYAGFWKRFGAAVIDYVILVAIAALLGWTAGAIYGQNASSPDPKIAEAIGNVIGILVWWLYYATLESSARQATLGKRALGIKVVDLQGGRVSFGRATGRHFAKFVSGLILMIGYLMAGFTSKKQALHDMMAGCLVVNLAATDEQVRQAPPAARLPAWQIALIVLGVGVLPVAAVMAVFVPVYQDRLLRARVAPVVATGVQATRKVEEYYLRNKAMPRNLKDAGVTDAPGRDVKRLSIDPHDGTVEITLAIPSLDGKTIRMVPKVGNGNRVEWTCSSDIPDGYLPAACRKP